MSLTLIAPEKLEQDSIWYRFSDFICYSGEPKISLERYAVVAKTRCGLWLVPGYYRSGKRKFLNLSASRHWCWPTLEKAWRSYGIRKQYHCGYLESQLRRAESCLSFSRQLLPSIILSHSIQLSPEEQNAIAS